MSIVTNIILTYSILEEEEQIDAINKYLIVNYGAGLGTVQERLTNPLSIYPVGGTKWFEAPLFLGAYNNFDTYKFYNYLDHLVWEEKKFVQLMVKEQEEDTFKILRLNDESE